MSEQEQIEKAFWNHTEADMRRAAQEMWDSRVPGDEIEITRKFLGDTISVSPDAEMERGYLHALMLAHHCGIDANVVRLRLVDAEDLDSSERRAILDAALRSLNEDGAATLDGMAARLESDAAATEELYEIACAAYPTILSASFTVLKYRTARRKRIELMRRAASEAERGMPVNEDKLASELKQARAVVQSDSGFYTAEDMIKSQLRALIDAEARGHERVNVGIAELDAEIRGFDAGCMTVIGARPSVGKSTLALLIARKASHPTLIISCEDSQETWAQRYTAASTGVSLGQLRDRRLEDPSQVNVIGERIQIAKAQPLVVRPCVGYRLDALQKEISAAVPRLGSRIVIVDYLQAVGFDPASRLDTRVRINTIVDGLKATSAGLGVHLVLLSQLKRGTNDHNEPQLLDLKESGRIEEAAENVLLMWRAHNRQVYARVAKNKNGTSGQLFSVTQDARTAAFGDFHREHFAPEPPKGKGGGMTW